MADTVGSYTLSSFTTPAANARPISSTVLKGNFNTLRDKLVAHDADQGLHVQHATFAGLPATGTASHATWVATDTGRVYLDLTNAAALTEIAYAPVTVSTGTHATPGGDIGTATSTAGFYTLYATTTSNAVAWARAYYDPATSKPVIVDRSAASGNLWFSTTAENGGSTVGLRNGTGGSLTYTLRIARVG